MDEKILSLRMALYRDTQPGQNVYWHGFGEPPVLSFRAAFDDMEFNRQRQLQRKLVKGRFAGGNLGWVMAEDMELFACLYRKPQSPPTPHPAERPTHHEKPRPVNKPPRQA